MIDFRRFAFVTMLMAGLTDAAWGATVFYSGVDTGAPAGGPFPNSTVSANSWQASAASFGSVSTLDFEAAPLGFFLNLTPSQLGVPGISIGPAGSGDGDDSEVVGVDTPLRGFNTTQGGSRYIHLIENSLGEPDIGVTFSFAAPLNAFGIWASGVGTAGGITTFEFNNGTSQLVTLSGSASGGAQFIGFTDDSNLISSVTIRVSPLAGDNSDEIGLDDVSFVTTPEPSTAALSLLGIGALAWVRRLSRKQQNSN